MTTLIVTFVRHGESEDNLKSIWAGWKDAPLSELGKRVYFVQAAAAGAYFSSTTISRIFASPLLRARATGEAIHADQPGSRRPPLELNLNLREQHFGIAEGHPWTFGKPEGKTNEQCFVEGIFPVLYERHENFPEGESLDGLARRAEQALRECVLPYLNSSEHIVLASHGLCIAELVAALLRLDPNSRRDTSYAGLQNTAWTRAEITVSGGITGTIDVANPPPLSVKITHVNQHTHLDGVVRSQDTSTDKKAAFFAGQRDNVEETASL